MDEDRFVISDELWERMWPLLPGKAGDPGATGRDNRRFMECHVPAPAAAKTETSSRAHQPCQQSWSSARHESARCLLVGLNDRSINHRIFEVGLTVYRIEKTLGYSGFRPSTEPFENRIPIAEILGQIAPRRACPHAPKNRLHEPTIVATTCSWIANFPGQQRPHLLPKCI